MAFAKIDCFTYHGFMKKFIGLSDASFLQPRKYIQKQKNIQNWMVITIEFNLHKLYIFIEIKTLYLHVNFLE